MKGILTTVLEGLRGRKRRREKKGFKLRDDVNRGGCKRTDKIQGTGKMGEQTGPINRQNALSCCHLQQNVMYVLCIICQNTQNYSFVMRTI